MGLAQVGGVGGVRGSRVAVVGGSIAGCAMAIALSGVGCQVTVFERSDALQDRGFGIGIPSALFAEFVAAGYLDPAMPTLTCRHRLLIVRDEKAGERGRVAWRQPFPAVLNNWGVVWRTLRARVPAGVTWRQATVTGIQSGAGGGEVVVEGRSVPFDLIVGADGYRSVVREHIGAGRPRYAGYSLWRGTYPASRLPHATANLRDLGISVMYPGGHGVCYLIPGLPGQEDRLNWAVYQTVPAPIGSGGVASLPPGSVAEHQAAGLERLIDRHFPRYWADVVRRSERTEIALQPVYDIKVDRYRLGRVVLAGDAGMLARPHVGLGAGKAIQDAMALARACREHQEWEPALAAYDGDRTAHGAALVDLGRRLGVAQVDRTPPWETMLPVDYERWWAALLGG